MSSLILTIIVIVLIYFVQNTNPYIAGLLAVVPVKIMGTALFTFESGGKEHLIQAVSGMLIGQFVWSFILLVVYLSLRQPP